MGIYPSDISREQFEIIRKDLESARKRTSLRNVDLYDVFCGVLYCLKGGIQWRMLPGDHLKWQLCYSYFSVWSEKREADSESTLERVLKKLVAKILIADGRKEKTSFIIIDAQSVKNSDTAEEKGYDVGKKVSGNKLSPPQGAGY